MQRLKKKATTTPAAEKPVPQEQRRGQPVLPSEVPGSHHKTGRAEALLLDGELSWKIFLWFF